MRSPFATLQRTASILCAGRGPTAPRRGIPRRLATLLLSSGSCHRFPQTPAIRGHLRNPASMRPAPTQGLSPWDTPGRPGALATALRVSTLARAFEKAPGRGGRRFRAGWGPWGGGSGRGEASSNWLVPGRPERGVQTGEAQVIEEHGEPEGRAVRMDDRAWARKGDRVSGRSSSADFQPPGGARKEP